MALEMKVPSPGESITEVEIAQWLVEDGDYVEKDQAVAEVDSDKATLELPAEASGIITLKAEEGDVVEVGEVVCLIDTDAAKPGSDSDSKEESKDDSKEESEEKDEEKSAETEEKERQESTKDKKDSDKADAKTQDPSKSSTPSQKQDDTYATGASSTCVGIDAITHFDLLSEDSDIKAAGAGATNMLTQVSTKNIVQIGTWTKKKVDLVLFDLKHVNEALENHKAARVQGILGADLLKKGKAIIDYKSKALYLK